MRRIADPGSGEARTDTHDRRSRSLDAAYIALASNGSSDRSPGSPMLCGIASWFGLRVRSDASCRISLPSSRAISRIKINSGSHFVYVQLTLVKYFHPPSTHQKISVTPSLNTGNPRRLKSRALIPAPSPSNTLNT